MRLFALWVVLFAVYAAGLGIHARTGDELVHLGIAQALIHEHKVVDAPQGAGFALLISPARELGGARGVELFLAAFAALGFVLSALLARRIAPEPYASGGAALAGLSAPAIAHAGSIYPELTAGTLLAGAAVCAMAVRDAPRIAPALGGGAMLAVLPWLGPLFVLPAVPIGASLYRWSRRAAATAARPDRDRDRRGLPGRLRHAQRAPVRRADAVVGQPAGSHRHRRADGGRLRRARAAARDAVGRPRRRPAALGADLRARVLLRLAAVALPPPPARPGDRRARDRRSAAASLALVVVGVQLLVAAFLVPAIDGNWFPGRYLAPALPAAGALVAWGLRHAPRPVTAALAALTLLASAWVLLD